MKELQKEFEGRGEVRGFRFRQISETKLGYLYEVDVDGAIHYETFKRKENTRFNTISYPTSKAFGIWAWSNTNLEKAKQRLQSFEKHQE